MASGRDDDLRSWPGIEKNGCKVSHGGSKEEHSSILVEHLRDPLLEPQRLEVVQACVVHTGSFAHNLEHCLGRSCDHITTKIDITHKIL